MDEVKDKHRALYHLIKALFYFAVSDILIYVLSPSKSIALVLIGIMLVSIGITAFSKPKNESEG